MAATVTSHPYFISLATMPLAPIGDTASGGRRPHHGRRRDRNKEKRNDRHDNGNDISGEGDGDDILALLESSTTPDSTPPATSSESSKASTGKHSALRDRKYGSTTTSSSLDRRQRRDSDESSISTKKVRFAGGVAAAQSSTSTKGKTASATISESSRRVRAPRSSAENNETNAGAIKDDDNRNRSTFDPIAKSLTSDDTSYRGATPSARRFEMTSRARDIGTSRSIAGSSDDTSIGRLQQQKERTSSTNDTTFESRKHEEQILTLKRRHEEEMKAIVAEHRDELERTKERELDAATLSNLVGPISESAQLMRTLKDEWISSKASSEEQSSRLAAEAERKLQMTQDRSKEEAALLRDAVSSLRDTAEDLKSQNLKEREQLEAERSRLESLQSSLQEEREQLLRLQQDERTKLMDRLEAFELERRRHAEEAKRQQNEVQRTRDDINREKSDLSLRMLEYEEKLERKRELIARDKELLMDAKDKLIQERADFEESKRMAKIELQGADASRRELAEMQSKIDTEMIRLDSLREQLQHQTSALLEKEASLNARLDQARQLEEKNEKTAMNLKAAQDEHDKASARLHDREERLLHTNLDTMKRRYYLQKGAVGATAAHASDAEGPGKYMYPPLAAGACYGRGRTSSVK